MENWDRSSLITELNQGKEFANELKRKIHSSSESCGLIMEKIMSTYDNALALLNGEGQGPDPDSTENSPLSVGSDHQHFTKKRKTLTRWSEQFHVCPDQSTDGQLVLRGKYPRKTLPRWSEQVHLCPEKSIDGQLVDDYNWRKYGQKSILGAKHPRAYYRCTYRNTQGCLATKLVQKTDKDPLVFDVTYRGNHTCSQEGVKQSQKNEIVNIDKHVETTNESGLKIENQELVAVFQRFPSFSFPITPIEVENVEAQLFPEHENIAVNSYSPLSTSESYFSLGVCRSLQSPESDLADINSSPTSLTSYPMGDLDFLMDLEPHVCEDSDFFSELLS